MPPDSSTPLWWLIVSGAFYFLGTLTFLALIYALFAIKSRVDRFFKKVEGIVDPAGEKVNRILDRAEKTVDTVATRVDRVTEEAEATARRLAERVDYVTGRYESIVLQPANQFSSIVAGLQGAWEKFRGRRAPRKDAGDSEPDAAE